MNLRFDKGYWVEEAQMLFVTRKNARDYIRAFLQPSEMPIQDVDLIVQKISDEEEKAWMVKILGPPYSFGLVPVKEMILEQETASIKTEALAKLTDKEKIVLGLM